MAGSLELISKTVVSSNTTSVTISPIFSDKYDVYKVLVTKTTSSSTNPYFFSLRFTDSSNSIISDSEYDYAQLYLKSNASFNENRAVNQDKLPEPFGETDASPESSSAVMYVYNPYSNSSYTFIQVQSSFAVEGVSKGGKYIGVYTDTEQVNGINIFRSSGSEEMAEATISVYGVK